MNHPLPKSTPKIDALVRAANSVPELRDQMVQQLIADGVVTSDPAQNGLEFTGRHSPETPPVTVTPAPDLQIRPDQRFERVIYPHANARIVLTGLSEDELDEIEHRVRATFFGR